MEMELTQQLRKHKDPQAGLIERMRNNVVDKIIKQELLYQAGQTLDIPDIDEKIKQKFQSIKAGLKSEERFQSDLKTYNQTVEQLQVTAKRKVFMEEYLKSQGLLDPHVSEKEIKSYYEKTPFKRDETMRLSHILLSVADGAKPEEKEKIHQKAEKLRRIIVEGADFAELAKEHSDSAEAKDAGGDLGYIKRNYMPPKFDKIVFSLKENELSKVFETPFGYHIVKLIDIRPAGTIPYQEVSDFIKRFLQNQRRPQMIAAHIEELRTKASIERK